MFGMNKKDKETLHQGGNIGANPRPTSKPPLAPGESKYETTAVKQKPLEEYTLGEIYEGSNGLKCLVIKALEKSMKDEYRIISID